MRRRSAAAPLRVKVRAAPPRRGPRAAQLSVRRRGRHGPAGRAAEPGAAAACAGQAHAGADRPRPGAAAGLRGAGAPALRPGAAAWHHRAEQPRHHRLRLPRRGDGAARQPRRGAVPDRPRRAHRPARRAARRARPARRGRRHRRDAPRRRRLRLDGHQARRRARRRRAPHYADRARPRANASARPLQSVNPLTDCNPGATLACPSSSGLRSTASPPPLQPGAAKKAL